MRNNTRKLWISVVGIILAIILGLGVWLLSKSNNSHIMLTIKATNTSSTIPEQDYWIGSTQVVYYDGHVEYSDEYHLAGKKNTKSWELNEQDIVDIQMFLDKLNVIENESVVDGIQHVITYYDKTGEIIFQHKGDITDSSFSKLVYYINQQN